MVWNWGPGPGKLTDCKCGMACDFKCVMSGRIMVRSLVERLLWT